MLPHGTRRGRQVDQIRFRQAKSLDQNSRADT
jgi:hypothetical protein